MKRRDALTIIGSSGIGFLTGCTGAPTASTSDSTATQDNTASVILENQLSVPSKHNIDIQTEVVQAEFSDTHPAKIRVTTTNTGQERQISVSAGPCSLFNRSRGGSDEPPGLWLHSPEVVDNIDREPGRWVADLPSDKPRGSAQYACSLKEYGSGESVSNEYVVWDDYQVPGYLKPGVYSWKQEIYTSEDQSNSSTAVESSFVWGFSLRVE